MQAHLACPSMMCCLSQGRCAVAKGGGTQLVIQQCAALCEPMRRGHSHAHRVVMQDRKCRVLRRLQQLALCEHRQCCEHRRSRGKSCGKCAATLAGNRECTYTSGCVPILSAVGLLATTDSDQGTKVGQYNVLRKIQHSQCTYGCQYIA